MHFLVTILYTKRSELQDNNNNNKGNIIIFSPLCYHPGD